jgi:hypothetical protein
MPVTDKQLERITATVNAYDKRRTGILTRLTSSVLGLWRPFRYWYDEDMVDAYTARTAVLMDQAQLEQRKLSQSYAKAMMRNAGSPLKESATPRIADLYPRSGVTIQDVYRRPAEQYRYARSTGLTPEVAKDRALTRIEDQLATDLALTERDETNRTYRANKQVIGTRRVIHPELSKTGTCGLCVIAADRVYGRHWRSTDSDGQVYGGLDDLEALHDRCKCTTAPMFEGKDPGFSLNRKDLDAIYAAAGSTYADELKRLRVTVSEHGELGPVLRWDGQQFQDVKKTNVLSTRGDKTWTSYKPTTKFDQTQSWRALVKSSERSIDRLKHARDTGETKVQIGDGVPATRVKDFDVAIKYHQSLIDRYKAKLAAL